jgi:hypothetical protein
MSFFRVTLSSQGTSIVSTFRRGWRGFRGGCRQSGGTRHGATLLIKLSTKLSGCTFSFYGRLPAQLWLAQSTTR